MKHEHLQEYVRTNFKTHLGLVWSNEILPYHDRVESPTLHRDFSPTALNARALPDDLYQHPQGTTPSFHAEYKMEEGRENVALQLWGLTTNVLSAKHLDSRIMYIVGLFPEKRGGKPVELKGIWSECLPEPTRVIIPTNHGWTNEQIELFRQRIVRCGWSHDIVEEHENSRRDPFALYPVEAIRTWEHPMNLLATKVKIQLSA